MSYSPINNPNHNGNSLKKWFEITADIYNYSSDSWSYDIVRQWFTTLNEAREYYLNHPERIINLFYTNLKVYKCVKEGEDPPPDKNGLRRHGIIQEQVL